MLQFLLDALDTWLRLELVASIAVMVIFVGGVFVIEVAG